MEYFVILLCLILLGIYLSNLVCLIIQIRSNRWHDYKTDPPEQGVEVIAFNRSWIDEDFNPNGTRVGFLGGEGFISAFWWDYKDTYITISSTEYDNNPSLFEDHKYCIDPEYWRPIQPFSNQFNKTHI